MSLLSVEFFIFFLPGLLLAHWVAPRRAGVQNALLLAASWVFYASWSWKLLLLLIVGSTLDFVLARRIELRIASGEPDAQRRAKQLLLASVVTSITILGFFKYENFFAVSLNDLLAALDVPARLPVIEILLPLGISYYTLQRVGYMFDVYWGRAPACSSVLQFYLFTSFFPQIAAGPISRASELLPQLARPRQLNPQLLADGAGMFLAGFVLKAWASDTIAAAVTPVIGGGDAFNVASHWIALIGYGFQVFADFAGYSLMAIGAAGLFGIDLPVNFNFPFLSKSLPEVWRRWHISLNRWLFDYVFTPLVTSNSWFRGRFDVALMLTFLVSGVWHGAAWTFVAWGTLHGVGMIVHRHWDEYYKGLCRRDRRFVTLRKSATYRGLSWMLTIGFFFLTLIPFMAPSFGSAIDFAVGLVRSEGTEQVRMGAVTWLAFGVVIGYHLIQLPRLQFLERSFWRLWDPVRGVAYGLLLAFLVFRTPPGSGTFIYQLF